MQEFVSETKTYLLSFPRSGNSWVRYIAEQISGHPSLGCVGNHEDVPLASNSLEDNPLSHVDLANTPVLQKTHGEALEDNGKNRLLFLTRNPSICVRRQCEEKFSFRGLRYYIHLLDVYNNWQGERTLLLYEDLIGKPQESVHKIASFLGINDDRAVDFFASYEFHRKNSIRLYCDPTSGLVPKGQSVTGGMDTGAPKLLDAVMVKILLRISGRGRYRPYFRL